MKKLIISLILMSLSMPNLAALADGLLPEKTKMDTSLSESHTSNMESEKQSITMNAGTRIPITLYNTVNSDNLKTGDMIAITVNDTVIVDGVTVFKKGSTGVLNISKSVKSGGHGRAGVLEISGGRITDTFGNQHPVNVSLSSKGSSKRGWAVTATVLGIILILTPFGIWVDGTPATLQGGQYIDALTTSSSIIKVPANACITECD